MEETVDVDALLKGLRTKGQDISVIVCNNQPYMDPEILEEIAAHLLANKKIKHLSLANCNVTDSLMEVSLNTYLKLLYHNHVGMFEKNALRLLTIRKL